MTNQNSGVGAGSLADAMREAERLASKGTAGQRRELLRYVREVRETTSEITVGLASLATVTGAEPPVHISLLLKQASEFDTSLCSVEAMIERSLHPNRD